MPKDISILHLISSLEMGGAEKLLVDTVRHSQNENISVIVVVMNSRVDEGLKAELQRACRQTYFLNRKESSRDPFYLLPILRVALQHRVQIIHSHNMGSRNWSILCKLILPRLKLVHTIHDTNFSQTTDKLNRFLIRMFIDINIAVSRAVLNECAKVGIPRVEHIYNGIDLKKYRKRRRGPVTDGPVRILNIARLYIRKKGQDVLINALAECRRNGLRFNCSLVGGAYEYDSSALVTLRHLIQKHNLQENVTFLGNRDDVPELLSSADIFVLPSRFEGLGLVVLEAMAAGVPVIASNVDGPGELIVHEQNGLLFQVNQHNDLANKIMQLVRDKQLQHSIAKKASAYVKRFDIHLMCERYQELYHRLLTAHRESEAVMMHTGSSLKKGHRFRSGLV